MTQTNKLSRGIALFLALVTVFSICSVSALAATGWVQDSKGWKYQTSSGFVTESWKKIGNYWYYFQPDGYMKTGWLDYGGSKYYLQDSGAMATGWTAINGKWYYFSPSSSDIGVMKTGWLKNGGYWYYLQPNGIMATGLVTVDGTRYYLDGSGHMANSKWVYVGSNWYYAQSGGALATGWLKLSGTWYYFLSDGRMATGHQTIDSDDYAFDSSGAMITGPELVDDNIYIYNTDGRLFQTANISNYSVSSATRTRMQNLHYFNQMSGTWYNRGIPNQPRTTVNVGGCGLMSLYAAWYMFTGTGLNDETTFTNLLYAANGDGYYTNTTTSFSKFGTRLHNLTGMTLRNLWECSVNNCTYSDAVWEKMRLELMAGNKLLIAVRSAHGSVFTSGNHIMLVDHYDKEKDAMFIFDPSMTQSKISKSGATPGTSNIQNGVYVTKDIMRLYVRPWSISSLSMSR